MNQINVSIQAISNGLLLIIPNPNSTPENPVQPHMQYFADKDLLAKFLFDFVSNIGVQKKDFTPEVVSKN